MVQIGEKEQGCKMIEGVKNNTLKQINLYFKKQSMNLKNLSAKNKTHKKVLNHLNNKEILKTFKKFFNFFRWRN